MQSVGLHFNGTDTRCEIPVSLTSAGTWRLTLVIATDQSDTTDSKVYRQACLFGYDSPGYKSRDFHADIKQGNLFIFSGLAGSNNASQLQSGTLQTDNGDFGWDTGKFVADGKPHSVEVSYRDGEVLVFLDSEYLGFLNVLTTINSNLLYLGASLPGESVYSRFDLYDFELEIDGELSVSYQPDANSIQTSTLVDKSGNSHDGSLIGSFSMAETTLTIVDADTQRNVASDRPDFPYINPGTADLLTTSGGTTLTDLPVTQSVTGVAFYQPNMAKCFDIPPTSEIWIRLDIYTTSSYKTGDRLRVYDDDGDRYNGWSTSLYSTDKYMLWHNNTLKTGPNFLATDKLHSMLLHMKSDGSNGVIEYWFSNGDSDRYVGNVNDGKKFQNIYIQMDGRNIWVSNLIISDKELSLTDNVVAGSFDAQRMLLNSVEKAFDLERLVTKSWRYENYGIAEALTVSGNTVRNLPYEKSRTTSAFWQSGREACFGIPPAKELWVKWDLYYTGSAKWRVYNRENGNDTGVARQSDATSLVCYINGPTMVNVKPAGTITKATRKTYLLHMVSDATNGIIELWVDGQKHYSDNFQSQGLVYKGNVNNGDYFTGLYMQSDNNTNLFSNVIISDGQIGLDENTWRETDAERVIHTSVALNFDTVRQIVSQETPVNADFDLSRVIVTSTGVIADTERELLYGGYLDADIERKLQNAVTVDFDTQRRLKIPVVGYHDTERVIQYSAEVTVDVQRVVLESVEFNCDIWRQLPHKVNENSASLQSVTIGLQEQQLTDSLSFVMAGDIGIMEAVNFQAWDYNLMGRVEQTSKRGVLISCQCTCDIDEILYRQMAYTIPENAFEWTYEYNEAYNNYKSEHQDEEINKMPSAPASAHITAIAQALGKSVAIQFDDWISTMTTDVKSGTNYGGLIEELFGWTARLPHIMINCYMRGNTIYAVQRGHENNIFSLDDKKLTVHTVAKKLVRTTWGSDPNNNTEVESLYKSWYSDDLTPWPPEEELDPPGGGGGAIHDNNGLVQETEVVHGQERVITTYKYTDLGGGQKFLSEEKTVTIIGDQRVDEVTTYHKPVSYGQTQVYSADEEGILGTTVSPANFDDRISPYRYQQMTTGGYSEAFVSGAHDEYGNYYPAVYDAAGNRYLVTGHTAHREQIGQRTRLNAYALLDTSFPVDGYDKLSYLTEQIKWLDRRTEESVTLELYDCPHLVDFNDRIIWHGNVYFLRSNTATRTETIVNRQTLEFVRWY